VSWIVEAEGIDLTEYKDYLQSPHWRTISRLVRERDENRCVVCNSDRNTQVHHRTYDGYPYGERLSDMYVLCADCHKWATEHMKGGK
jgi:5-methylcytosine-specific restriction endonuclease McrA